MHIYTHKHTYVDAHKYAYMYVIANKHEKRKKQGLGEKDYFLGNMLIPCMHRHNVQGHMYIHTKIQISTPDMVLLIYACTHFNPSEINIRMRL